MSSDPLNPLYKGTTNDWDRYVADQVHEELNERKALREARFSEVLVYDPDMERSMDINAMFPSKYLKAHDLKGRSVKCIIDKVEAEEVNQGEEPLPVLYFRGKDKGVVLNKTNANMIASVHGTETDTWPGAEVILYADKTTFAGRIVDCIRIKPETPKLAVEEDGDEVPF